MSLIEFGHFAAILALVLAVIQASVPLVGARLDDARLMAVGAPAALAQLACLAVACSALAVAFLESDFTVALVANNSHTAKPTLYKLTGLWGNHEGSLLLWVTVLAAFGAVLALGGRRLPAGLKASTLAVQGLLGVAFLGFMLSTSNPFLRLFPPPLDGNDLNPLLQHPGLALHPPLLYGGYVGLSLTFSLAVGALIEGRIDSGWARWLRPWALAAWALLTAGIALGSWWAYSELGWGGFWFWDPVENASFIPWLMATALLHSAIVVEKRDTLKVWTVLLAILAFALVMLGTFIVRSGVITSVHAFAVDPDRGVVILALMTLLTGGALTLFAWRAPQIAPGGLFRPVSRESALLLNNLVLTAAAATIAVGTLYPLGIELLAELHVLDPATRISVGAPFFNATFTPLMVPLLAVGAIAPMIGWKRGDLSGIAQRLAAIAAITLCGTVLAAVLTWGDDPLGLIGVAIALWVIAGTVSDLGRRIGLGRLQARDVRGRLLGLPSSAWGMALAHLGVGVMILGITGTSLWTHDLLARLQPGQSLSGHGLTLTLQAVDPVAGPNFDAWRATLLVHDQDGALLARLQPEQRVYRVGGDQTTEAAITTHGLTDLYGVLGDGDAERGWAVHLQIKPMVVLIWLGALLMVVGGVLSMADRRLRLASGRRAAPPGAAPSAAPPGAAPSAALLALGAGR